MYTNVLPACVYMCTMYISVGFLELFNGCFLTTMWGLGIESGTSTRAESAFNH